MRLTFSEITRIIQPDICGREKPQMTYSSFLTDSRKLLYPPDTVFFALKTHLRDGHIFINDLFHKGVRLFVVAKGYKCDAEMLEDACFLMVDSPLKALHYIAAAYRSRFSIPVIGITGSNGKTIVKEWVYHLLSLFRSTVRSPKSYNSQTGVPLSVLLIEPSHEFAVFEAGISKPDEMEALERMIRPGFGILTNIGPPHAENFQTDEAKILEKLLLFIHAEKIVCNSAHRQVIETGTRNSLLKQEQFFLWGTDPNNDIVIRTISKLSDKTCFTVRIDQRILDFEIPFTDDASAENALHAFSLMVLLGFDAEQTAAAMKTLPVIAMRLELQNGINHCLIINDTYNSDLHSLSIALDFLKQQQQGRKATVIMSDILQSGIEPDSLYLQTAGLLGERNINRFIGIGPDIVSHRELFSTINESQFFRTTEQFLSEVKLSSFQNEIILVKGARDFSFERIVSLFDNKLHQTVLEVNLSAIQHNLNVFRSMLNSGTGIMAMVKAFSYGTGSHEIAGFLEYQGIQYLGVAYADEGVDLRMKGIQMPIMVMAPEYASIGSIIANNLEPEIYNFESLSWLRSFTDDTIKIHLKFDTGMHRLGFDPDEIPELCDQLKAMPNIMVMSVFSHLAAADDPTEAEYSNRQIQMFDSMCSRFAEQYGRMPLRHILNSAGTDSFPAAQYDMVRLGLAIYGIQPSETSQLPLQQVARLKTRIIQTKNIKKGERIGYGSVFTSHSDMQIAVIPIGYADGFRRSLSNGRGKVFMGGTPCKVAGNVCMDMTMIDVTGLNVQVGEQVVIFDEHFSIADLAKDMNVIPYEVLTGISQRVKRQYLME
jgi:Alr-MurF fusion protein